MERFQVELQKVEIVSTSYSIVDILKKTKRALNNGDPAYEILPESNQETAQYLLLLSMDSPEMLESMISFEYDKALITARIGSGTSQEKEKVVRRLEKLLEESFGKDTRVTLTGTSVLTTRMSRLLTVGQLRSIGSALIFVLLLLVTIFRSLPYGVFCGAPIILTVLLIFGVMGWIGIPLDVASAMVASIAVGIGVDYSIHLFNRFREEKRKQRVEAALQIGIKETGKAILYNAVAVGAGFLILVFSSFPPLARFGGLVALAMLISALGAIVVLPSLLKLKKEV